MRRFTSPFFAGFLFAVLLGLLTSGCACFEKARVEARADYRVLAEDATVSIVAVGYVRD